MAPVLRDAASRSLAELAAERARLVDGRPGRHASTGGSSRGGTVTLSNLGAYPVDFFAPVVSGPQIAMVATGRIAESPSPRAAGSPCAPRMWVNVAIDHRAADGEAGGRLLAALERQLAIPARRCPMTIAPVPRRRGSARRAPGRARRRRTLLELYRDMVRVRAFEEEVVAAFGAGLIPGSTHPCIGQEAIKAGALSALRRGRSRVRHLSRSRRGDPARAWTRSG